MDNDDDDEDQDSFADCIEQNMRYVFFSVDGGSIHIYNQYICLCVHHQREKKTKKIEDHFRFLVIN